MPTTFKGLQFCSDKIWRGKDPHLLLMINLVFNGSLKSILIPDIGKGQNPFIRWHDINDDARKQIATQKLGACIIFETHAP